MEFDYNLLRSGMYIFGKKEKEWRLFKVLNTPILRCLKTGKQCLVGDLDHVEAIYSRSIQSILDDATKDVVYSSYSAPAYLLVKAGQVRNDAYVHHISVLSGRLPRKEDDDTLGTYIQSGAIVYPSFQSKGRLLWHARHGYCFASDSCYDGYFNPDLFHTVISFEQWEAQFEDYSKPEPWKVLPATDNSVGILSSSTPWENLPQSAGSDNSVILNTNNTNGTEQDKHGSAIEVQGQAAAIQRGKAVTGSAAQLGTGSVAIEVGHLSYQTCDSR